MTTQDHHTKAPGSNTAQPQVRIEVLDATSHRFLAHVGDADLPLNADAPDRTPRMRDEEFSRWVGQEKVHVTRKLIRSMIASKKFNRDEVLHCQDRNPGEGGRPATVYWLTREQALLVATQCATPRAWAVTRLMARVFDAVLDRMTPTALVDPSELADLRERVNVLEAGGSNGGVIGEWFAQTRIIRPLQYAANLLAAVNGRTFKSQYRSLLNVLEREARYGKNGERWSSFPAAPERVSSVLAFVQRTMTAAEREHRAWQKTRPSEQSSLFELAS